MSIEQAPPANTDKLDVSLEAYRKKNIVQDGMMNKQRCFSHHLFFQVTPIWRVLEHCCVSVLWAHMLEVSPSCKVLAGCLIVCENTRHVVKRAKRAQLGSFSVRSPCDWDEPKINADAWKQQLVAWKNRTSTPNIATVDTKAWNKSYWWMNRIFHWNLKMTPDLKSEIHAPNHCCWLGGGFKYFVFFIPIWGNDPIWLMHIFQMGWFNHQPVVSMWTLGGEVGDLDDGEVAEKSRE